MIALIGACWALYPGCILDVDGEEPQLRALATYYAGALWVAERDDVIVGMIATRALADGAWEICKVYVAPDLHGAGLGAVLLATAEAHAIAAGATRLVLWSDTRFDRAHRFYENHSYVRSGPIRVLHDQSNSLEFPYAKPVNGVETLDIAAAYAAEPRLSAILTACVAEGAGVSFLPPLSRDTARAFWRKAATNVGNGDYILLGAWSGGVLAGTVTLALAKPQNQPHRADVAQLLVDPTLRRRGIARALMIRLEQEASIRGRTLLSLDTQTEGKAERLYRSLGWTLLGVMPGHTVLMDGTLGDTSFFWKWLETPPAG